jgi:hypothetical protein
VCDVETQYVAHRDGLVALIHKANVNVVALSGKGGTRGEEREGGGERG